MFEEGVDCPMHMAIDDPFVERISVLYPHNRESFKCAREMGCRTVCVYQEPTYGIYTILFPRGAFGETMERSAFWNLRNAKEKLKSAYMELEEMPEQAKEVRQIVKWLEEIERLVDEKL